MLISILSLSLILVACGGDSNEDTSTDDQTSGDETSGDETSGDSNGDESASGDWEEQEWGFVTEEMQGEVQYEYAAEFARRIEEKTGGAITVQPYEFGSLGSEVNQAELLMQGGIEMAVMSPGFTGNMVPDGQIFSLHYFFPADPAKTQEVLNTSEALNQDLRAKYEEHNITPLAYWTEGSMAWTANTKIDEPSDWEGLKMRVQESPLMRKTYETYGATVQSISWGELYTALERGTVDAQENPLFFINSASFNEVQDYLMISNHNNYIAMTTVNTQWFNNLSQKEQDLVTETIDEMRSWIFEEQKRQNNKGLEEIKNDSEYPTEVVKFTEEQVAEFRKVAEPVHEYYRNEVEGVDPAIYDKLKKEIEAVMNGE